MIREGPTPGAPDIIIANKNPANELLHSVANEMNRLTYLARPEAWDRTDYFKIAELPNPIAELDTLRGVTQVIKLIADAPELQLLERAHSFENMVSFRYISKRRKENSEVRSVEPQIPFSSFELVLYKRIAQDSDFWYWEYEKEITQNLTDAMDANPSVTWQTMQLFGIDMIIPALSNLRREERAAIARTIKQEMARPDNTKTGSAIFCDALAQTRIDRNQEALPEANRFRSIIQLLPQLYTYYDESTPELEPQQHEYYMHIALALAYYSEIRGTGPFGAIIVDPYGFLFGATNEIEYKNSPPTHAETVLMKKARAYWGPDITDLTLYSTAEPCFGCAGAVLDGGSVSRVVYGAPTTMGMDFFGISGAKHLTKLKNGDPEMVSGVLEAQIRAFYKSVGYVDLIRPET